VIAAHQNKSGIGVCHRSSSQEFTTGVHHKSSSRKILRSDLCQLGVDEEPEEVAGSCDVI
jgi:hypothetical protein